jgi:hypothetical protein
MPTAIGRSPVDGSHLLEVLEVADSILRRHHDRELAEKTFVLQKYLEMNRKHREPDYEDMLRKTLEDLTATVCSHLNSELETAATLFVNLP